MRDSEDLPDAILSASEVKRALERAVQIDAKRQTLSVSDLTAAAREAGISEEAVLQAVQELIGERQLTPAGDRSSSAPIEHVRRASPWLIGVTSGLSLLIGLMVLFVMLRIFH